MDSSIHLHTIENGTNTLFDKKIKKIIFFDKKLNKNYLFEYNIV